MNPHNFFMQRYRSEIIVCLFLIMAILAVYWPVKDYPFVTLDDSGYVTQNRRVKAGWSKEGFNWAFTTTHHRHWHPLTWLSHMTDVQLFGLDAGRHHLTSLFFHIANTILLFLILNRITGARRRSAFVAALFALHPLHVESVAWISDRKDLLCALFWLLTMGAYARYAEHPGILRYGLVFLLFTLALMAKAMAITLPLIFLLMDFWPLGRFLPGQAAGTEDRQSQLSELPSKRRRASLLRLLGEKLFFFAILGVGVVATYVAVHKGQAMVMSHLRITPDYIAGALVAYVSYLGKMIWPQNLAVPYPNMESTPLWQALGAGTVLVFVSIAAIIWTRKRPYLLTGWLWFLVTLLPVIGLVQGGPHAMGDRYTYIALIGLFIVIAWGVPDMLAGWRHRKLVLATGAALIIAGLMAASWRQLSYWENSVALYTHTIEVTENNAVPHNNLGNALRRKGNLEEAIPHYAAAVRIDPNYTTAHINLANALRRQGKLEEAIEHYNAALRIKPNSSRARNGLRNALNKQGAVGEYSSSFPFGGVSTKKRDPAATLTRMGDALMKKGRFELAGRHYNRALRLNPGNATAHKGLAAALVKKGKFKEAIGHYDEALKINPGDTKAREEREAALRLIGNSADSPATVVQPLIP